MFAALNLDAYSVGELLVLRDRVGEKKTVTSDVAAFSFLVDLSRKGVMKLVYSCTQTRSLVFIFSLFEPQR